MTLQTQSRLHHHRHTICNRHPSKPITGFCASCLRERLAGIDPDTHQETPITHLAAELRRSKSYSSSSNPNASSSSTTTTSTTTVSEPRRKSCDVRSKNTLSDLFHNDDKKKYSFCRKPKGLGLDLDLGLELKEEEETGVDIRVFDEINGVNGNVCEENLEDEFDEDGELKTMKEFIDLEWERKKNGGRDLRDIAGSFWEVASTFRKKLVKWQIKQKKEKKDKKENRLGFVKDGNLASIRRLRETQSEVGEYRFGRRSCDTDPRLSVDAARLSVDDARYSFDEPRASWDGYLIGRTHPRLAPLVAVKEDMKLHANGNENENENVKDDVESKNEGERSPGGTAQTRDYYSDRRRRRSFDRLGSTRRLTLGDDEFKAISNAKVSPETVGLFHGAKLLVTEKELRDSNWYSLKDYQAESTDVLPKNVESVVGGASKKGFKFKKLQTWRNIWGLMQRRSESKFEEEERSNGGNVVDGSATESWQKLSEVAKVEAKGIVSQKLIRSYTISAKDSSKMACSASNIDTKENGMKRREDLVLQRNRSARYSPNNLDTGLLRFYLTPLRSYGRSKSGKSRLQHSHSLASSNNVL